MSMSVLLFVSFYICTLSVWEARKQLRVKNRDTGHEGDKCHKMGQAIAIAGSVVNLSNAKKKKGKNTNETSKWYCGKKKEQKNRMEMSRQRWNILQQLLTEERTHTHTLTHRQTHSQQNLYLCEPRCGAISVTLGICIYAINIYAQIKTNCRKASWKSGISDGFV